jgi:hypothetical protein
MNKANRPKLDERVRRAAEAALAEQKYVSPLDVIVRIGWLPYSTEKSWRQGRIEHLEGVLQTSRAVEAVRLLGAWATDRGLIPRETDYVGQGLDRRRLRFSASGDPELEREYRTHWISPDLSDARRERLVAKASRAPELVVVDPRNEAWTCHRCGRVGGLLIMENPGPACLGCVGLGDLEFLPPGDPRLTRRAKAKSTRFAVVVRFSRARKRYERQGVLVEPSALAEARRELANEA